MSLPRSLSTVLLLGVFAAPGLAQPPAGTAPLGQQTVTRATSFPEGARLAYVDLDRVAALSSAGKEAASRIDEVRVKRNAELAERSKQMAALELKATQSTSVPNDDGRLRLQREFQRARVSFERLREDVQTELQDLQEELLRTFTGRVFPVIAEIAKEKSLWAVFSGQTELLWHDPALDLSEEVARRLDAKPQK
jgi:outer membrane protein